MLLFCYWFLFPFIPSSSSSSSSCPLRVRRCYFSLILKMKLVPPSLLRSSHVPSSFRSVFQCLSWYPNCVHPLYVFQPLFLVLFYFLYYPISPIYHKYFQCGPLISFVLLVRKYLRCRKSNISSDILAKPCFFHHLFKAQIFYYSYMCFSPNSFNFGQKLILDLQMHLKPQSVPDRKQSSLQRQILYSNDRASLISK